MNPSINQYELSSEKASKDSYPRYLKYKQGQRYHNYVLVGEKAYRYSNFEKGCNSWECLCDCGNTFITSTRQIHRGKKSCGCLRLTSQFRKKDDKIESNHRVYIQRYKVNAEKRNLKWDLNDKDALKFFTAVCFYCESPPSRSVSTLKNCPAVLVNGIDRVDNNLGYNLENIVSCCTICNRAKNNMDLKTFLSWIEKLKKVSSNHLGKIPFA